MRGLRGDQDSGISQERGLTPVRGVEIQLHEKTFNQQLDQAPFTFSKHVSAEQLLLEGNNAKPAGCFYRFFSCILNHSIFAGGFW